MISVIMSCYKEPLEYIEEAVVSILNQTYQDIELIIIVDDPTNHEAIEYVSSMANSDKRLRFYINDKNMGLTASLNRAKGLTNGDFVARMDADDISELDRLECQLRCLQEGNYDIVGCNVRDMDDAGHITNTEGTNYPTQDKSIKKYLKINSAIPHPSWLVRKELYRLYDYVDFPACEDYEFLTRVALDGYRLGNIKDCKLKYRINRNGISSSKKVNQKTSFSYVRNNYRKGKKSILANYFMYLNSDEGRRKQQRLSSYYDCSERLKLHRANNESFKFMMLGFKTFITEPEGRNIVTNTLKEKLVQFRYGKKY